MRKFKYKGKSSHIGHLGYVDKGQTVTLSEQDAYYVQGNSDYVLLREYKVEGFPEEPGLPPKGGHFDISSLPWKSKKIFTAVNDLRRVKLTHAVGQLEASGFPVLPIDGRTDLNHMRDIILVIGRLADWI